MPSRLRDLLLTSLWIALAVCALLPNPAIATLTVDLRAVSTTNGTVVSPKEVLFTGGVGDTVTMNVFMVISGMIDPDTDNDYLDFLHGSFLSSFGGLQGNLS